jgi:hypothetical protein
MRSSFAVIAQQYPIIAQNVRAGRGRARYKLGIVRNPEFVFLGCIVVLKVRILHERRVRLRCRVTCALLLFDPGEHATAIFLAVDFPRATASSNADSSGVSYKPSIALEWRAYSRASTLRRISSAVIRCA